MRKAFNSEQLEPLIFRIRGRRVVLDADLARLYGVTTTRFNEAFRRNRHRFPGDFAFQMTADELENLRSQIAISSLQSTDSPKDSSRRSQFVVRAFVRLREQVAANTAILKRLAEIDKTLVQHDAVPSDLYRKLLPLLQPPADPPKRRIGFHTDND